MTTSKTMTNNTTTIPAAPPPVADPHPVVTLPLDLVRTDGDTQPRASLSQDAVDDYGEAFTRGDDFPPVTVFYDGTDYWLADGFHRHAGATKAGLVEIRAAVRQGTRSDAQWFSFSANHAHGLRRTNADKARAVQAALLHSPDKSDAEIARHVGVDDHTVAKYRSQVNSSSETPKIQTPAAPSVRTVKRSAVRRMIKAEMFYRPAHQTVFATLCNMSDDDEPVDLVTLRDHLNVRGLLEKVGGIEYLTSVVEGVPDSGNAEYYAKVVRDRHLARQMISAGNRLASDAHQCTDATELLHRHERDIFDLSSQVEPTRVVTAGEAAQQALDHARAVAAGEIDPGIMSGFIEIDAATGGFQPGDFVTVAADTSVGKSALALCTAYNMACDQEQHGGFVFYVSAEMRARELGRRLLASISGVPSDVIKAGRYSDAQLQALIEAKALLDSKPLLIMDTHASPGEIAEMARHEAMKRGRRLTAIFIDYLQLMVATTGDTRAQQVGMMAQDFKRTAMESGAIVIALSQFSRGHNNQGRRPEIYDLKESGDIENHSNTVILLDCVQGSDLDTDGAALIDVKIAKCRDGITTCWPSQGGPYMGIQLRLIRNITRFESKRPTQ